MGSIKVCADCKYHHKDWSSIDYCSSPNHEVDIITGKRLLYSCSTNRNTFKRCSIDARWFEEKEKPFWKKVLLGIKQ